MSDTDQLEQLLDRWEALREQGHEVSAETLCGDAPELVLPLRSLIHELKAMDWLDHPAEERTDCLTCAAPVPGVLAGRYHLELLIAEGGFGQVWRATDTALQRPVAVKLTTQNCVDEARRVARLKHPGIISVHDVGNEVGYCFIVFDLVEGANLADRIRHGRLSWPESAALVATVAEHLQYAHDKGFIHRDVKPANILIDQDGQPILADFGIAVTESELRHEVVTSTGTLAYMAPEQLVSGGTIDARTDVYSLGVVLYEMLTGELPFQGDTIAEVRDQILNAWPVAIEHLNPSVPQRLTQMVEHCLAKAPGARYARAAHLALDLRTLLKHGN
jgi:serine/threonine-protein kinase